MQVIERGRPFAHFATMLCMAGTPVSKWEARYRDVGEIGLEDRSSAPATYLARLPTWVVELIEHWRR